MGRKKKAAKKKMGRPPVKSPKKYLIALRITKEEREHLMKKAKAANMSLSSYVMLPHRRKDK